jgi:hypothetical protein
MKIYPKSYFVLKTYFLRPCSVGRVLSVLESINSSVFGEKSFITQSTSYPDPRPYQSPPQIILFGTEADFTGGLAASQPRVPPTAENARASERFCFTWIRRVSWGLLELTRLNPTYRTSCFWLRVVLNWAGIRPKKTLGKPLCRTRPNGFKHCSG